MFCPNNLVSQYSLVLTHLLASTWKHGSCRYSILKYGSYWHFWVKFSFSLPNKSSKYDCTLHDYFVNFGARLLTSKLRLHFKSKMNSQYHCFACPSCISAIKIHLSTKASLEKDSCVLFFFLLFNLPYRLALVSFWRKSRLPSTKALVSWNIGIFPVIPGHLISFRSLSKIVQTGL